MGQWWEIATSDPLQILPSHRAVAYYRHSAQDRQENSIPIQQEQVREWAEKAGITIIEEFADAGKSGLNAEGRPAFKQMMEEWVKQRYDFTYVLCLDVSRWGRFQDIDLSAQYSAECKKHNKQVVYVTIGMPKEDDPLYPVYVQFERFRAARYSKELSDKVFRGEKLVVQQGYWPGGSPPYATQRLLLDEKREPLHTLEPGQHKAIHNQRVMLVEGDALQVAVIRRIFDEFTELRHSHHRIAEGLNADGIVSPGGAQWKPASVLDRLRNETYVGTLVYNKTSQKLKTPKRPNPPEKWIRHEKAFEGIITLEQFLLAQQIMAERRQKYDPAYMLQEVGSIYAEYGLFRSSLLRLKPDLPTAGTYARQFGSLDFAFQHLHREQREKARQLVQERILQHVPGVLPYADFLVLDERLALTIQPSVPIPHGYSAYWPFRPDSRQVIDITLGVLLADHEELEILGYVALPRLLSGDDSLRISAQSARVDQFGRCDLSFLQQLLEN
jgi:DNA invertase Pin-like site-specific DNA recombinase